MASRAVYRWKQGKRASEARCVELRIGTRLPAELVLDDPIAADHHCTIALGTSGFVLREGASATGTFLNGVLVVGDMPLAVGDRIALGVSHITIAAVAGDAVDFVVDEGSFWFTPKTREQFQSDADEWVRSEVRFGGFRPLRRANWFTAAAVLLLLPLVWFVAAAESALQPGRLSHAHAWLLEGPIDAAVVRAAKLGIAADVVVELRDAGCAACHTPYAGASADACLRCHADLDLGRESSGTRHPFRLSERTNCVVCHAEHSGGELPLLLHASGNTACADCHPGEYSDPERVAAFLAGLADRPADPSDVRPRRVTPGFEAFAHASHNAIDCAICHERSERSDTDFTAPSYELCAACHDATPLAEVDDDRFAARPTDAALLFDVDWHGSAEGRCEACHERRFDSALRTVEVLEPVDAELSLLAFELLTRDHANEIARGDPTHGGGRACAECHTSGVVHTPSGSTRTRAFRHAEHLSNVAPSDDGERTVANAQCLECHPGQYASGALVAAPDHYAGTDLAACAKCHVDAAGVGLVLAAHRAQDVASRRRATVAFPHDRHTGLVGGCLACHSFTSSDGSALEQPSTRDSVRNCTECHVEELAAGRVHAQLGASGAGCAFCHPSGSDGRMASVFHGARGGWEHATAFSHWTGPERGHASRTCGECHGRPTEPGEDVRVLGGGSGVCAECHAQSRFHWR